MPTRNSKLHLIRMNSFSERVVLIIPRLTSLMLLLFVCASGLSGQTATYEVDLGGGLAVPTGILGRERGAWPVIRAGVQKRQVKAPVRFRLDLEALWMGSSAAADSNNVGALGSVSLVESALIGPAKPALAPYGILGMGLQWLVNRTPDTYPVALLGVRVGGGLRGAVGRYRVSLEVATQLGVLSNYGHVSSAKIGSYWPITVGLTF